MKIEANPKGCGGGGGGGYHHPDELVPTPWHPTPDIAALIPPLFALLHFLAYSLNGPEMLEAKEQAIELV